MQEVRNVYDLIQVMHDDPSNCKDEEFSILQTMIKDENFSISQLKEYKPDLYKWITKKTKEFWERRE